jgi:predicted anti-sigma-YlaC factor YlaD
MHCDDVRAALSAAEGGAIPPEGEEHLKTCAGCRAWALGLDRLPERLEAFEAPALPDGFERRVTARLRRPLSTWALIAAELLIFALGMLAGYGATRMMSDASVAADTSVMEPVEVVMRD